MKKNQKLIILLMASIFIVVSCSDHAPDENQSGNGSSTVKTTTQNNPEGSPNTGNNNNNGNNGTENVIIGDIGTKAAIEPKAVGDIVFVDGTATPYSVFKDYDDETKNSKKQYVIAVIFYVGSDLNSGSDTSIRTLGVGIHHQSGLSWAKENQASAYDIDIETIRCRSENNSTPLFLATADKNGSDNLKQISDYLKTLSDVEDDTSIAANYPAFYYAKNYGTTYNITGDYATGWYFPSFAELVEIYNSINDAQNGITLDEIKGLCSDTQFLSGAYICSSQVDNYPYYIPVFFFDTGTFQSASKNATADNLYVCAIREFN